MMKHALFALTLSMSAPLLAAPPAAAEPESTHDARMAWWREARFGMFVHWGLYSGLAGTWDGKKVADHGGMEWIQAIVGVDTDTYAAAAKPMFRPRPGFAKEWAKLAKEAGCQYVVFTTKHHEGFALHDSKAGDYDAGHLLGRDLVKEITDALNAEGLRVGFYHSVIDWHHPDYDFTKAKGLPYPENASKETRKRDHARYVDFLHRQVDELTSNYGKVDVLWWDYSSTEFDGDEAWRAFDLIAEVRKKQPGIIMNNRLFRRPEAGFTGMSTSDVSNKMDTRYGDFVTPENHIPATGLPGVDWETCMTMNTSWGYSEHDHAWKSSQQIIRNLIDIASKGGNYLINVGPMADGTIPSESVERMQAVGAWLAKNGESIRGTTASPFEKLGFEGRCTAKGDVLFLHVFQRPESGVIEIPAKQEKAVLLGGGELKSERVNGSLRIHLPASLPDPVASVIRLE